MKTPANHLRAKETLVKELNAMEAAQKLELVRLNTEEGFILIDTNFTILTFNHSFQKLYINFCDQELMEDESFIFYIPYDREETLQNFCRKAFLGSEGTKETDITLPDQSIGTFSFGFKPAFDKHKKIIGAYISLKEITNQKATEEKKPQNETRYKVLDENGRDGITEKKMSEKIIMDERLLLRTLIDHLPMNVYAKDIYSRKTLANRADCEFMGAASEKDVLGKDDSAFFPPEFAEKTFREEQEIFITGQAIISEEEQHVLKDGSKRWFLKSKIPLKNEDNQIAGLLGISYDITERKKNEIDIRELNHQLNKRAEDLAASNTELERFAYVASHDLQEPLRMVSSFLQLLQKQYKDQLDETAGQYITYAVDGANRMKALIFDLLEYSRVGTNKEVLADTDMNEVISRVLETFANKIEDSAANIQVQQMPVIRANKTQITQLIQNLLSNSLKYNHSAAPKIQISCEDKGDSWQFAIKDNGIGIEEKFFQKVFVIFQRLHVRSKFSGTGIGLAICKKITERHGGEIWIESGDGEGSTFFFTIRK